MRSVGFRCPVGFINYPASVPFSTEILTPAATRSGSEDGMRPVLGAGRTSMQDSETQRQESSEAPNYREEARFLSSFLLSREKRRVEDELGEIVEDLKRDRFVEQEQIAEATHELMGAIDAINAVAMAQEGTHPMMEAAAGYDLIDREDSTE